MSSTPMTLQRALRISLATLACLLSSLSGNAQPIEVPQPSTGLMPNIAKGKTLFATHCAKCHGGDLKGSKEGPPLLHPYYKPDHHADAAFQIAVRYGVRAHHWQFGNMAPVPGVSADDTAHIIAFIRREQRNAGLIP